MNDLNHGGLPWSRSGLGPLDKMGEVSARADCLRADADLTAAGRKRVADAEHRFRVAGEAWEAARSPADRAAACAAAGIALLDLAKIERQVRDETRAQFYAITTAIAKTGDRPASVPRCVKTARPRAARRIAQGAVRATRLAMASADASPASPSPGSRDGSKPAAPEDDDPDGRYLRVGPGSWQPLACLGIPEAAALGVA